MPFTSLLQGGVPTGAFKSTAEMADVFAAAGVDVNKPVLCTCGSGATAAVLVNALAQLGAAQVGLALLFHMRLTTPMPVATVNAHSAFPPVATRSSEGLLLVVRQACLCCTPPWGPLPCSSGVATGNQRLCCGGPCSKLEH